MEGHNLWSTRICGFVYLQDLLFVEVQEQLPCGRQVPTAISKRANTSHTCSCILNNFISQTHVFVCVFLIDLLLLHPPCATLLSCTIRSPNPQMWEKGSKRENQPRSAVASSIHSVTRHIQKKRTNSQTMFLDL